MRNAFIDELVQLASVNPQIALVVGDLGYSVVEPFADKYPERFINSGVAEQNMAGLAAGMASEGYHVFTYSIANFPTFRCAEQIRNDIAYQGLPVTVVSVGGGLAYGALGYSHHAVQDYALMRCYPNMLIAAPGDPMETRACLRYLIDNPCPSYFRLGKAGEPVFHKNIPGVSPGEWLSVVDAQNGCTDTILTTGSTLALGLNWRETKLHDWAVKSMPLWGMGTKKTQAIQVEKHSKIITIEDHLIDGGFGSWLLESLVDEPRSRERITIKGLDSGVCGLVGSQKALNKAGGLPS